MKIAITSMGDSIKSFVDLRFRRAEGFVIYDTESRQLTYVDNNKNLNALQGAGIQYAENVISKGLRLS